MPPAAKTSDPKKLVSFKLSRRDAVLIYNEAARQRKTISDLLRTLLRPLLDRLRKQQAAIDASEALSDARRLPG